MKERVNQLFKDKLVLVMLVLGLLTIVAAAGAVRIRKGAQNMEESPYLEIKEPEGMIAGETEPPRTVAGSSNAQEAAPAPAGSALFPYASYILCFKISRNDRSSSFTARVTILDRSISI